MLQLKKKQNKTKQKKKHTITHTQKKKLLLDYGCSATPLDMTSSPPTSSDPIITSLLTSSPPSSPIFTHLASRDVEKFKGEVARVGEESLKLVNGKDKKTVTQTIAALEDITLIPEMLEPLVEYEGFVDAANLRDESGMNFFDLFVYGVFKCFQGSEEEEGEGEVKKEKVYKVTRRVFAIISNPKASHPTEAVCIKNAFKLPSSTDYDPPVTALNLIVQCGDVHLVSLINESFSVSKVPGNASVSYALNMSRYDIASLITWEEYDSVDSTGNTLLHAHAVRCNLPAINFLLSNSCDPNLPGRQGYTPTHLACRSGNLDAVKAMVERGGRVRENGRDGLDMAVMQGERGVDAAGWIRRERGRGRDGV